jgi:hypothetical protein
LFGIACIAKKPGCYCETSDKANTYFIHGISHFIDSMMERTQLVVDGMTLAASCFGLMTLTSVVYHQMFMLSLRFSTQYPIFFWPVFTVLLPMDAMMKTRVMLDVWRDFQRSPAARGKTVNPRVWE